MPKRLSEPQMLIAALLLIFCFCETAGSQSRLPGMALLHFEQNAGQTDAQVKFLARGPGYALFLTPSEAVFSLRKSMPPKEGADLPRAVRIEPPPYEDAVMRMQLVGIDSDGAKIEGLKELSGKSSYFLGNDPSKWRTDVSLFSSVKYREVYPGIDLVFYGAGEGGLEYDFIAAPGADPKKIRIRFEGADSLRLDPQGNLVLRIGDREIVQKKPEMYQQTGEGKAGVIGGYAAAGNKEVSFDIKEYDHSRPLIIDPVLEYSTYLGGGGDDYVTNMAVDPDGSLYVVGFTDSLNFPNKASYQSNGSGSTDVFVSKFGPDGRELVYSTYVGGRLPDWNPCVAADSSGSVYLGGTTYSDDFPIKSAFQPNAGFAAGHWTGFVSKLSPSGSELVYSTYLGGEACARGTSVSSLAIDSGGSAYVTGYTGCDDFPTKNPIQLGSGGAFHPNVFVTKLSPAGSDLDYSTFLGGQNADEATGIAVDSTGAAYVTGMTRSEDFPTRNPIQATYGGNDGDVFVTKLNPTGSDLDYSTYIGGSGSESAEDIAVSPSGAAYVVGYTTSDNFPVTSNAFQAQKAGDSAGDMDGFIIKINRFGTMIDYATYFGGTNRDGLRSLALDIDENIYFAGYTASSDFPVKNSPMPQLPAQGGHFDATVSEINTSRLMFSTRFGGSSDQMALAVAVDPDRNVYVAGQTTALDFPTKKAFQNTFGGGGCDGFILKLGKPYIFLR